MTQTVSNPIVIALDGVYVLTVTSSEGGFAGLQLLSPAGPPLSPELSTDGGATWAALVYPHTLAAGEQVRLTRTDTSTALSVIHALAPVSGTADSDGDTGGGDTGTGGGGAGGGDTGGDTGTAYTINGIDAAFEDNWTDADGQIGGEIYSFASPATATSSATLTYTRSGMVTAFTRSDVGLTTAYAWREEQGRLYTTWPTGVSPRGDDVLTYTV